ncbi:MAG: AMP-binding protein [Rubrivivax sp.]
MPAGLPLLAGRDAQATLAWHDGKAIDTGVFLAEAAQLAERLPHAGHAVNLCVDRYCFAVALVAAALRGHVSLLPPNAMPLTLQQLRQPGNGLYALSDGADADCAGLPRVHVARVPGVTPLHAQPRVHSTGDAVCLLTSGSTGAAQPHGKSWAALQANGRAEGQRLAQILGRPNLHGLTLVATVPAQHSYGFESSVLLALFGGAAFDSTRPFYPADICAAMQRVPRPRALVTTPFHLKTLLAAGLDLPAADLILSATAPLSPQLAARAEAAFGGPLIEIYGCTEAGQVATRRTTQDDVWTAFAGLQLRAHDDDAVEGGRRTLVQGGHVHEPTLLGDVIELLDSQRFRLLGRANDLIHVAGKRSSLAHLNFMLNQVDGVEDGAFWLPDEVIEGVVRPVAFVVAPSLSARDIIGALRGRLEAAFVPRKVVHVAALPREATGKLSAAAWRAFVLRTLAHTAPTPASLSTVTTDPTQRHQSGVHIDANHPALAGHFPGAPVLPGALLAALVCEALAHTPALVRVVPGRADGPLQIDELKLLAPVRPPADLRIGLWPLPGGGIGFEVHANTSLAARGRLRRTDAP